MSAEGDYLNWRRQSAVGCMFARYLAGRPSDYQQRIVVVPTRRGPLRASADLAERIGDLAADQLIVAATLLFPGLETLEDTARVMLGLKSYDHWSVTTSRLAPPPQRELVAVHVSRQIPFGRATCPSEALVLGDFDEFPNTRRAPVTAMEIYVGQPRRDDPKTGQPTIKANLAHMDLNLPTPTAWDRMWAASEKGRLDSLGGPDNRAKAKVSFVIPVPIARRLECLP
jgi:hypothetical protein